MSGVFNRNLSVAVVVSNRKRSAKGYSEKLGFESSVQWHWVTVWPRWADWKIQLCDQPRSKLESGNTYLPLREGPRGNSQGTQEESCEIRDGPSPGPIGDFGMLKDPDGNDIWINEDAP